MEKILLTLFLAWFLISVLAGFLFVDPWATLYYAAWGIGFAYLFYRKRKQLQAFFKKIPLPLKIKCILIGVVMILIEEAIVGIIMPLALGQGPAAIPLRILQQQIFNLLALGPILVMWTFVAWRYYFSMLTVMFISGVFSAVLYEGAFTLFANPIVGLWGLPLYIWAHALIYYTPYLAAQERIQKSKRSFLKWIVLFLALLITYLVTGFVLSMVQEAAPMLFPPDQ